MIKFEILTDTLKKELNSGKYKIGSKFPSMYDIARIYGVNKTTANKVILALLSDGYLSRAASARGGMLVKSNQSFPVGKIAFVGTLTHSFSNLNAVGIFDTANLYNYFIMPFSPKIDLLNATIRKIENAGFQGIVSVSYGILHTNLPTVYIGSLYQEEPDHLVISDDYKGSFQITEMLLRAGHHEIVSYMDFPSEHTLRIQGFYDALRKHNLTDIPGRLFRKKGTSLTSWVQSLKQMLQTFPRLTAIVCDSDDQTFQLIRAAMSLGIRIPEDITVTGFGNVKEVQSILRCPTVEQHPYDMGVRACENLIGLIEKRTDIPKVDVLDVEIINPLQAFLRS